jgi:hypothetical protein
MSGRYFAPLAGVLWCLALPALTPAASAQTTNNEDSGWWHPFTMEKASQPGDWTQHIRLGAVLGFNIKANFNESGLFNVSGNNAANGIYDDGYVQPDQSGDPAHTGFWGYNNASQYNGGAQTLTMHSTTSYSTAGSSEDHGGPFPGVELAYGIDLWKWKPVRVGLELGLGIVPIDISDTTPMAATVNQTAYTFSTAGIVVPAAPYQGGPSGAGEPIISTASTTSAGAVVGTVTGKRELDVILYTLRLGPTVSFDLPENFAVMLGAGPAVGLVSGDYKFNEVITTAGTSTRNTGQFGAADFVFGGYANATLVYRFSDEGRNGDIYIGAQYMPMGNADFNSGGREGRLNLEGQAYVSAGFSWPF